MLYVFRLIRGRNVLIASVLYRVQLWSDRNSLFPPPSFSLLRYKPVPLSTSLGVRHPRSFMHNEGQKERKDLAPSPFTSRVWVIHMRNSASRHLYFQADLSFQKQADTLGTKTDQRNYNKKQCSAKAAGRSLSGRMMEQEEWCSNRQRGEKERVKSVRNWRRLQGTQHCLMGQKLRNKRTTVQGDLHFSKTISKRWKVVDEMLCFAFISLCLCTCVIHFM